MARVPSNPGWQRLDARMLLVHPVRDLVRFLPALVGILVFGQSSDGGGRWLLLGVGVPVVLGLARYLTTSYRITTGRVEVRQGLLNKRVLSAPLDRVRTVDLTASPIHRVLGLVTLRIGTGQSSGNGEERLALDGLTATAASGLRERLLHGHVSQLTNRDVAATAAAGHVVLTLDLRWVRFAPFTSSGVAIAGAALGVVAQSAHTLEILPSVDLDSAARLGAVALVVLGLLGVLLTICVLAVVGYLLTNFDFQLLRTGTEWHVRRGLFTTRETTLDQARVSGVSIGEPWGLRLAGGARLSAIVTGLDRRQRGSSVLVPPAPRAEVERVSAEVLGSAAPVTSRLVGHGPRAHRRRWTRAMVPAGGVALGALVAGYAVSWWFLPLAAAALALGAVLAHDRWRALGHALVDGHLVARSGSLDRRREALHTASVIGWNLRATWFQRRVGLTHLVATTAGGRQQVRVLDLDEAAATDLAASATPRLLEEFLTRPPGRPLR